MTIVAFDRLVMRRCKYLLERKAARLVSHAVRDGDLRRAICVVGLFTKRRAVDANLREYVKRRAV